MKILLSSICLETGTDIQIALYYLKGFLLKRQAVHNSALEVKIKVFNENQSVSVIVEKIFCLKPRLVGFSCYLWNIEKILKVSSRLKKIDSRLKIVLGGPEVSPQAEKILAENKAIDAVVRGEGELSFAELAESIFFKKFELSLIRGISFRRGNSVINNPDRPHLADLASIPSPYLSGLVNLKDKDIVDVPLETMRGCFYRCHYCYYHKNFSAVRYFPLARIEKELKLILSYRPREVYLMDATFNACSDRAKKILKLFIRYNKSSNLHLELKADLVDEEMAGLLYQARAFNIEIGIQSIKQKTLKAVNRKLDKNKFKKGILLLNKYKLFYEIQLIDALPFQSYADLERSLDWLYALHPAKLSIFRLSMIPGTFLRQRAVYYGIKFSLEPPYHACKSRDLSSSDLLKIEKLQFAMERLYDAQVFQKTLYLLKDKAGIKISEVLRAWIIWESRLERRGPLYLGLLNKKLPEFLKYVCRKHHKTTFYKTLLPDLLQSLSDPN